NEHVRVVDEGSVMRVQFVQEAESIAHSPHPELGSEGQGHERQVRLREIDGELAPARVLAGFHAYLGACVWIDLAEEGQLDFAREEKVLQAGEATTLVLLDVALG